MVNEGAAETNRYQRSLESLLNTRTIVHDEDDERAASFSPNVISQEFSQTVSIDPKLMRTMNHKYTSSVQ